MIPAEVNPVEAPGGKTALGPRVEPCLQHGGGIGDHGVHDLSNGISSPVLFEIQLGQLEVCLRILLVHSHRLPQLGEGAAGAALARVDSRQDCVREGRTLAERNCSLARIHGLAKAIELQVDGSEVGIGHPPAGLKLDGALQVLDRLIHPPQ